MSRTRWLLAVVCLVGCGCGPNKPGDRAHDRLRTQADAALKQADALDYQSPVSTVRAQRRAKAADLYLQSCTKDGDVSSCVWAASLSRRVPWNSNGADADAARLRAATDVLVERCLAHDPVACRAFDGDLGESARDYSGSTDELCAKGFARACYASSQWVATEQRMRTQLDPEMLALLKKGCDLGDPAACDFAISLAKEKTEPQADEIAQLTTKLQKAATERCSHGYPVSCDAIPHNQEKTAAVAAESCTHGYLEACSLPPGDPAKEQRWAKACSMTGIRCDDVAEFASDAATKRDALEHGCQLGDPTVCVTLVQAYHAKTFPEPVSGRADALVAYLCSPKPDRSPDYCDEVKPSR